jgi:hypothetical protein
MKDQFLSSILKHLSIDPNISDDIFSEFPGELVLDALETINKKDIYVHPLVMNVLQKLAGTVQDTQELRWTHVERKTLGDIREDEMKEQLTAVFKEDAISSDYRDTLANLVTAAQVPESGESVEHMSDAISKDNVEGKMVDVIIEILGKDIPDEEFSRLIGKLGDMSVFFLETGQFNILAKTYDILESYAKSENETRKAVSNETVQSFSEKSFMEEVINGFDLWGKEKYEDIATLIRRTGPVFIPPLLDRLSKEQDTQKRTFLVELITTFGAAATSEAIKRVEDSDPYFIRKLIIVLRQSNDRNLIPAVQRFVKHHDPKVKIEALKTLLHFDAPGVSSIVGDSIIAGNDEISKTAIFLAGVYKVRDVKNLLLYILRKSLFWGANIEKKIACVRALGDIGDPSVMPELNKIYRIRNLFRRNALTKLKVSIIRSLAKYPDDEAAAFLETLSCLNGSKNSDLQKECRETLNKIMK